MSAETYIRIIFALVAVGMAIYLAVALVTGHTRVGGCSVERSAASRLYWGSVGKIAIMTTGLAIAVTQPSDDLRLPLTFLAVFGGQLFEMLVSGIVPMPKGAFSKADRPASYWRWVAFHAAIVALLIAFLIMERTRFTIL